MARLIIILALVAGFIMLYRSLFGSKPNLEGPEETADMVQDPNCGTYVPKKQSVSKVVLDKEHFFCSKKCADEFSSKNSKK
jgi:uncharacterized protein